MVEAAITPIPIWMMNYSSGAIVEVELKSFTDIITKAEKPLVITVLSGVAKRVQVSYDI